MDKHKINAHKVTKPIQLLAAWLVGLSLINITFLSAAANIIVPSWIPGALVIASILNVPIFIGSIFLLQTKYRPEMQEDSYYSEYLGRKSDKLEIDRVNNQQPNFKEEELTNKISKIAKNNPDDLVEKIKELISVEHIDELSKLYGDRRTLSELYLRPDNWSNIINKWKDSSDLKSDIHNFTKSGLISIKDNKLDKLSLTELGQKVAKRAEEKDLLFAQKNSTFFWNKDKEQ